MTLAHLEATWGGESGREPGRFKLPRYVCALPDGAGVCVADTGNRRLQMLKPDGSGATCICDDGTLRGPSGLECDGKFLYVVDAGEHCVLKLSAELDEESRTDEAQTVLGRAGRHGSRSPQDLWCPQDVAISKRFASEVKE